MTKFVSVLIPCFNAEAWIEKAIESALAQTYLHKEVVVVDDGSTDGSLDIIRQFDGRIRWETGPNRGGNAARNKLLELGGGEWLQYLDADDWLHPDKISRQVEFLDSNAETDVVFGPATLEHWSENSVWHELAPIPVPHDPWILLARWYLPQTGAPLWRRQAILDVGRWNERQPCCQEHELYLRLLMAGKRFSYCESGGAVYRQWSELTVCRRDRSETRRCRLEIEKNAERFLRESNELTATRQTAINLARFEMARIAWHDDRDVALNIVKTIRRSQPDFRPAGKAAPAGYRLMHGVLGFRMAETIADWRRRGLAVLRTG